MNKEDVKYFIALAYLITWTILTIVYHFKNPVTIDSLTVEERIRYEQMIFP